MSSSLSVGSFQGVGLLNHPVEPLQLGEGRESGGWAKLLNTNCGCGKPLREIKFALGSWATLPEQLESASQFPCNQIKQCMYVYCMTNAQQTHLGTDFALYLRRTNSLLIIAGGNVTASPFSRILLTSCALCNQSTDALQKGSQPCEKCDPYLALILFFW